jgi:hypothetical protein
MDVLERVTSLFPIAKGHVVSPQESAASILQVSSEFEKVYTSINKFNSSVSEGAEQISVHTISLKKKLQELKKALIQVNTHELYLIHIKFFYSPQMLQRMLLQKMQKL